jgi:hypothetical protein
MQRSSATSRPLAASLASYASVHPGQQGLSRRAAPQKAPRIALTFDSPDTIIRSRTEQMLHL